MRRGREGIVQAIEMLEAARGELIDTPLVVRLDDNNAAEGRRILEEAEHDIVEMVDTMDGAARRATELAAQEVLRDGDSPHRTHPPPFPG